MWDVKKNYPKSDKDAVCSICRKEEDATEQVVEVKVEKEKHAIASSNIYHWTQTLKIFRENQNERNREVK